MIKYFCDYCDVEVPPTIDHKCIESDTHSKNGSVLQVMLCNINKSRPDEVVCKYCLIDAILKIDDRPRMEVNDNEGS